VDGNDDGTLVYEPNCYGERTRSPLRGHRPLRSPPRFALRVARAAAREERCDKLKTGNCADLGRVKLIKLGQARSTQIEPDQR
jgi:hypothetical protein